MPSRRAALGIAHTAPHDRRTPRAAPCVCLYTYELLVCYVSYRFSVHESPEHPEHTALSAMAALGSSPQSSPSILHAPSPILSLRGLTRHTLYGVSCLGVLACQA